MFVKVRDDFAQMSRQKVSPAGFWGTNGVTLAFVCMINVYVTHEAKYAVWSRRGDYLCLAGIWAFALYAIVSGFVRYRRWVFPLPMLAGFIGITLTTLGHALPHSRFTAFGVQSLANALFLIFLLCLFVQFGWGRPHTPSDKTADPSAPGADEVR